MLFLLVGVLPSKTGLSANNRKQEVPSVNLGAKQPPAAAAPESQGESRSVSQSTEDSDDDEAPKIQWRIKPAESPESGASGSKSALIREFSGQNWAGLGVGSGSLQVKGDAGLDLVLYSSDSISLQGGVAAGLSLNRYSSSDSDFRLRALLVGTLNFAPAARLVEAPYVSLAAGLNWSVASYSSTGLDSDERLPVIRLAMGKRFPLVAGLTYRPEVQVSWLGSQGLSGNLVPFSFSYCFGGGF